MIPRRISLLLMLFAGAAQADTLYKCTDPAGHTTYTNQKGDAKNCVILSQDKPVSTFAPPPTKPRANTPTPESFPKVSSETQKGRDSDRRRILDARILVMATPMWTKKGKSALSNGDQPGVALGIMSSKIMGMCEITMASTDVEAEGGGVVRTLDQSNSNI